MLFWKSHARRFQFLLVASTVLVGTVACSMERFKSNPKAIELPSGVKRAPIEAQNQPQSTPNDNKTSDADAAAEKAKSLELTTNYAEGRQRKNLVQLKDAIFSCVGKAGDESILKVVDDMLGYEEQFIDQNNLTKFPNNTGRNRFLSQTVYAAAVGKSVLDVEGEFLDIGSTRTGLRADSLEDEIYLKSLVTVASVVAFNCDVKDPSSNCYCADEISAKQMLARCLPQFSPASEAYQSAIKELYSAENCGAPDSTEDGLKRRRRAVAALLSSYAFATSK
ncbi:MAG: hypothetical protein RLZZ488_1238 [Pseudomonadota bacterium]|jgi:hypothetical protein